MNKPRVIERATALDFREALTIQWPDGSETVELLSQTAADFLFPVPPEEANADEA